MNVFIYEMKQYRKSIITWAATLAVSAFVLLSATPLFIDEVGGMKDVMTGFPDAVKEALGIDLDTFFSAVGFYSYIFFYIGLAAAIQAMNLGLGIISKETRMKTADFLMSKPIKRSSVYLQKLLAALCALGITEAAFFVSAWLSMLYVSEGGFAVKPFWLISLTFTFYQLIYLALGLLIAATASKIKSTLTLTMGVAFGTFIVGMIGAIANSEALRYLSPLKYFDGNYIMMNNAYEPKFLILGAALTVVSAAASFAIYVKKDIKAVT